MTESTAMTAAAPTSADWRRCGEIAREHGRTFHFASRFLPPQRRRAMLAAYAYCRVADDIVDRAEQTGPDAASTAIDAWESELDRPRDGVAIAFAAARAQYGVPVGPVRDLLAGVRMDLEPATYETWDDLRGYCYHVAGTIGLISSPILGCRDASALPHAVNLGIAMQLTNILRDVAEDAKMDRVYLPQEDLERFRVSREALLAGRVTGRFDQLLAFEIARARELYRDAGQGVGALHPAGQITTLASSHLYSKILCKIEERGYDVFGARAHVPTSRKVRAVPVIAASFVRLHM